MSVPHKLSRLIFFLLLLPLSAGSIVSCGLKGPLYLPETAPESVKEPSK